MPSLLALTFSSNWVLAAAAEAGFCRAYQPRDTAFLQGMNSEQMMQCITGPSSLHMRETPIFPATSKVLLLLLYRWFGASFTASASVALR
jgi:hypothetical protein